MGQVKTRTTLEGVRGGSPLSLADGEIANSSLNIRPLKFDGRCLKVDEPHTCDMLQVRFLPDKDNAV